MVSKAYILSVISEQLVRALVSNVTDESVRKALDVILDKIEQVVADSGNKYDDAVILPVLNALRAALQIPDYVDAWVGYEQSSSIPVPDYNYTYSAAGEGVV